MLLLSKGGGSQANSPVRRRLARPVFLSNNAGEIQPLIHLPMIAMWLESVLQVVKSSLP